MANSARYNKLFSRVSFLEKSLLPKVKITGNYTKKESDLIRSYILLVHAEIESYFEDIAKDKVTKAFKEWETNRKKSNCLLSVITFSSGEVLPKKHKLNNIEARIKSKIYCYLGSLDKNHGIKSNNIYSMLLPIGIEENQFDETWLSTMDNFGITRGSIAHSTHSVQSQIDLTTEKNRINNHIMPEIKNLDEIIKKII